MSRVYVVDLKIFYKKYQKIYSAHEKEFKAQNKLKNNNCIEKRYKIDFYLMSNIFYQALLPFGIEKAYLKIK